jgi:hypothetical protein
LPVTHHHDGTLQASGRVLLELYLKLLHYLSLVVPAAVEATTA